MRPVLVTLPQDVVVVLGVVLAALGGVWALVGLWRWARRPDPAVTTGDRLAGLGTAGLLVAVGLLATRYTGLGVPLYSYGIFLGLGLVAGYVLAVRGAARLHLPPAAVRAVLVAGLVVGLVGARALFVAQRWPLFRDADWRLLAGLDRDAGAGGLAALGGLVVGALAAAVAARAARVSFWGVADAAAPGLSAGLLCLRLGSFLFGSDYGTPAGDWPLAVRFPGLSLDGCRGSPAFEHHCACLLGREPPGADCAGVAGDLALPGGGLASLPVHPVQLYEAGLGLALLVATTALLRRRAFAGQVFLLFLLVYAAARFLTETLRADLLPVRFGGYTLTQLLALAAVPIALAAGYWLWRRRLRGSDRPAP